MSLPRKTNLSKLYYQLTKPGIIYGNALTAAAGFFLASEGTVNWWIFVAMLIGLSFIVGSAAVFNNYIDRDIDALMERTKNRALPTGQIAPRNALIFGTFLGIVGVKILLLYTSLLTLEVALFGFAVYVLVYSPLKRKTMYASHLGALAGAVPPVVGYVAVTNSLDATALVLFLILCCWQMAHFFSIAIYRKDEYANAHIPVMPLVKGLRVTKLAIIAYIVVFALACLALPVVHTINHLYVLIVSLFSIIWLRYALAAFWTHDDAKWARQTFLCSLLVILALSIALSIS
jgi:protoheme IX farnesyltransferase